MATDFRRTSDGIHRYRPITRRGQTRNRRDRLPVDCRGYDALSDQRMWCCQFEGEPMSERGVLFDVDGTLVDTTYLHATCWAEALRQVGHVLPMASIHRAIGMGSTELLEHLLGADRDHDEDDTMREGHRALYAQYWTRLHPFPAAADLLRTCAARGLDVVLASSASGDELAALQAVLDADDAISAATSSSDADAGKPHPDVLQAALDKSGLRPSSAVFVGDAVWDGQAAGKVNIPFIGLTCGGTSAAELRDAGAAEVYADPAQLLAQISNSAIGTLIDR
jgi:HAD superfamily hydrolase (TIGR01509 family)